MHEIKMARVFMVNQIEFDFETVRHKVFTLYLTV